MKLLFAICLILMAVGIPIYFLYWRVFRPVLILRLKHRLFQSRDEMRLLQIHGGFRDYGKAYALLERFCNKGIVAIDFVDLADLIGQKVDKASLLKVEKDFETIANSSAPIRKIFHDCILTCIGAVLANSPGFLIVFAPVVIFSVTALWFGKAKLFIVSVLKRVFGAFYMEPC